MYYDCKRIVPPVSGKVSPTSAACDPGQSAHRYSRLANPYIGHRPGVRIGCKGYLTSDSQDIDLT